MDIEFHYHITFILSRQAGFSADESYKIAYSSQYTDDNTYHYYVNYDDGGCYMNHITQTFDITKPSEKRQKVYPLFHFIPGGTEAKDKCRFNCGDATGFVTIPNSENANKLLQNALEFQDLYRIGIALHAFADTWSHQNFLGLKHELNAQRGLVAEIIPNIAHADFRHEPDKIHNKWKDGRLQDQYANIDNDERFLEAARMIFVHQYRHMSPGTSDQQALARYEELQLAKSLQDAMDESYWYGRSEDARIKAYKGICSELGQAEYQYDSNAWRYAAVEKKPLEIDLFDRYWAKEGFEDSDWFKFQEAAKAHRTDALRILEPVYNEAGLKI